MSDNTRDKFVLKKLTAHYGIKSNWHTEHLEHYHVYLMLLAYEINERIYDMVLIEYRAPYKKLKANVRLASELIDELPENLASAEEETFVQGSTFDDDLAAKVYLVDLLVKDIEKKVRLAEHRVSALNDAKQREALAEKLKGKLSFTKPRFEFLDYLATKFGSINKALTYLDAHPVIKSPKLETLKREYRKYRNDLDK